MNSNQATIQKLEKMGMWGMMRALRQSMEAGTKADFTPDESNKKAWQRPTLPPLARQLFAEQTARAVKRQYHRRSKALTSVLGVPRPRVFFRPQEASSESDPRAGRVLRSKSSANGRHWRSNAVCTRACPAWRGACGLSASPAHAFDFGCLWTSPVNLSWFIWLAVIRP
jgi:hypothetical protein